MEIKEGKLVAKKRRREIETIVTIREECETCDGTGLVYEGEYSTDCYECQGFGMIQVSKRKEINHELQ